jgi:hypothetical protein
MVVDGWVSLIEGDVRAMKGVSAEGWERIAATTQVSEEAEKGGRTDVHSTVKPPTTQYKEASTVHTIRVK